ncbi:MAG: single-stranded-DNA-specific exonuclease RecJ [Bacteroidota bacterium]
MHKQWLFRPLPASSAVTTLADAISVNPAIATLLVQKGITSFDQARDYFRPSLADLHDPFAMQGMRKAVRRLIQAIKSHEAVLVYGDYDVDGVTAVALVYGFIKRLHDRVQFYVPDRYTEGYGFSQQAVSWAARMGIRLIITLDCGIKAVHCIQQAQAAGIDVIVCDHHEPGGVLPPAYAILDPKQPTCSYPFKELSGCGVGFKLLQALSLHAKLPAEPLYTYLDLVAVSIACDLVPMIGENRILAYHGLHKLNTHPHLGLRSLIQAANLCPPLGASALVFGLGPRLNAAGRIDHGSLAVHLLLATDQATADALARTLEAKNDLRKYLDSTITAEAISMLASDAHAAQAKTTVLFKEDWHKGVIGIVAARCIEQYHRPTVILTAAGGKATGSARSVRGFNIYEALTACHDLLDQYGGHAHAAGLTLPLERVADFQERFEAVVARSIQDDLLVPTQRVDLSISLDTIDAKFYNVLKQMGPFGNGNMKASFATDPVVASSYSVLKDKHLKLYVYQPGMCHRLEAIGFGLAKYEPVIRDQKPFRIVYTLGENDYLGARSLQLTIKDIQGK